VQVFLIRHVFSWEDIIKKCKILMKYMKSRIFKYDKGFQEPEGFLSNWFCINKKGNSRENFMNCVRKSEYGCSSRNRKLVDFGE
jgi:hypothetical protein